ncbi:MAG: RAD55 family ATPase [Chloroflexota bacterium]
MAADRITTGAEGLDAMLGGGFIPGSTVLVRGTPGTGKTSLALQFLIHGAGSGDTPLLVSFEESPASLYRDAQALGWNLEDLEDRGALHFVFTSPEIFLSGLESPESALSRLMCQADGRRIVLDSVSHFDDFTDDSGELRRIYTRVVNGLRRERATALLLVEETGSSHQLAYPRGLSSLVDVVIVMRYVEIAAAVQRAILVLKMRGSDHGKEIRRYRIEPGGLRVLDVFEGCEGLLSGTPHLAFG